jgi:hypothetical protein
MYKLFFNTLRVTLKLTTRTNVIIMSVISTRMSVVFFYFIYVVLCGFDTQKCDFDTHECDFCTQSVISARTNVIHICMIVILIRPSVITTRKVWFLYAKCDIEHIDVMVVKAFTMLGFIRRLSFEFRDP